MQIQAQKQAEAIRYYQDKLKELHQNDTEKDKVGTTDAIIKVTPCFAIGLATSNKFILDLLSSCFHFFCSCLGSSS